MLVTLLIVALCLILMGFVAWIKVDAFLGMATWVTGGMEPTTKRVAGCCLAPGAVIAVWLNLQGIELVAGLVVGMSASFGVFCISLAILGIEGLLTEPESQQQLRAKAGESPPTSTLGRMIASTVGLAFVAIALYAVHIVSGA